MPSNPVKLPDRLSARPRDGADRRGRFDALRLPQFERVRGVRVDASEWDWAEVTLATAGQESHLEAPYYGSSVIPMQNVIRRL